MKICVTAVSGNLDAQVDPRFGRCQYLLIVNSETMESKAILNEAFQVAHGAGIQAAQTVANSGVKVVITGNVGPNAFKVLSTAGITIVTGVSGSARDAVEKYKKGQLQEIVGPTVGGHFGMGRKDVAKGGEKMNVRIVVPVSDERGIDSQLSEHFGSAPYYAIIDLDDKGHIIGQETISNTSEHFGGVGHPPDRILQLQPKALITYGMGQRALRIFQNAKVAVLRTSANTVRDVVRAYTNNELEELTQGCQHAQHQ